MNLLELVQSLHYEAKLPGTVPDTVAGQTGRADDLVRWIIEAHNDIQRDRDGKWKWLRSSFTLDTAADDSSYSYGNCIDSVDVAAITRFRSWYMDQRELPFIYLIADGEASERELAIADFPWFRREYRLGTHTASYPSVISVSVSDKLVLGPTPDGIYKVTGKYWKSNQVLALDADIPEMPTDYHMLIVYRAMMKYGYNVVAQELLARASSEGALLYDALAENQSFSRFSVVTAGALA